MVRRYAFLEWSPVLMKYVTGKMLGVFGEIEICGKSLQLKLGPMVKWS